jgi:SAM-dependent methyltransferase
MFAGAMAFKDHFSGHAADYAKYRPDYPADLYEYLATLSGKRELAVDCATGSGQAAVGLAAHFDCVVGTDGSVEQLHNAQPHERVKYVANLAEQLAFKDESVDLMSAAQAAHWFDHEKFYREVRRVLRPQGVLALWTYGLAQITPEVDRVVAEFYQHRLGPYWPPERRYVESAYRDLPFPMEAIATPAFRLDLNWNLDALVGYLGTWSALQRYKKAKGEDPLPELRRQLLAVWPAETESVPVVWPLHLKVGRR